MQNAFHDSRFVLQAELAFTAKRVRQVIATRLERLGAQAPSLHMKIHPRRRRLS